MTYFISDLHLNHRNIIKLERTQFSSVEEHDDYIIEKLNEQVRVTDTLYILGDVWTPKLLLKINGAKHLLLGNHDKRGMHHYTSVVDKVYRHPFYFNRRIFLSHYPHPVPPGVLNIHGHLHGGKLGSIQHINVSINDRDYLVLDLRDVNRHIDTLINASRDSLESWYKDLYITL